MKITLIYNNISINDDIIADYRFYCFIEDGIEEIFEL
jgi:hypothetical protein